MYKNIILLGFRYSGKSTIGKIIAKNNNYDFVDLDHEIEKHTGRSIKDITNDGKDWKNFRDIEFALLPQYLAKSNIVLSCGGGVGVNELYGKQQALLLNELNNSLKIIFETNEQTLQKRKEGSYYRPLLDNVDIVSIWNERKKLYDNIDYDCKIDSSEDHIYEAIRNHSLCAIIGYPVKHSLSPLIHNSCYRDFQELRNNVFTKIEIRPDKIFKIRDIIKAISLRGISVTSPYKEQIMEYLDTIDSVAAEIGAVNTIVNDNNNLIGYNTDYIGVYKALEKFLDSQKTKVAIFGSGGASKSAIFALKNKVSEIVLFSRTENKENSFIAKNQIKSMLIKDFRPEDFDIIINGTTVGLNSNESILSKKQILKKHIVFDMVYNPLTTQLLKIARENKAQIVYGTEMLIYQAVEQLILYNKIVPNINTIRNVIYRDYYRECVSIKGTTIAEFIRNLKKAQMVVNFVELRVDYIKNLSFKDIDKISNTLNTEAIITCRMQKDGGHFTDDVLKQREIIEYAISKNRFKYLDIDLNNAEHYVSLFNDNKRSYQVILSYHNFNSITTNEKYLSILDKMSTFKSDIRKIAVRINTHEEILNLLNVFQSIIATGPAIVSPITDNMIFRLMTYEFGSWTNFFSLNDEEKTASGQIDINDFYKIKNLLQ